MSDVGVVVAAIGLGANLGDRARNIDEAVRLLRETDGVRSVVLGPVIETEAVAWPCEGDQQDRVRPRTDLAPPIGATKDIDAGGPYLNSAALVETTRSARELLSELHAIERRLGRDRAREPRRWGPRTIDLDLLLYGDLVVEEEGLRVPHPRMHERRFVLEPLCAIAGEMVVPTLGESVAALLQKLIERECPSRAADGSGAKTILAMVAAACGLVIGAPDAAAQAPRPGPAAAGAAPAREEMTPTDVLRRLHAAYASEPWAERVRMLVTSEDGVTRGSTYVVRYAPASVGGARPAALLVDLGRVRIFTDGQEVVAVTPSASEVAFRREVGVEREPAAQAVAARDVLAAMREVFPPLPLPQVAVAVLNEKTFEDAADRPRVELLSMVGPVTFESTRSDDRGRTLTLRGRAEAAGGGGLGARPADVELLVYAETGRLRRITVTYDRAGDGERAGEQAATIEMEFGRLVPGDSIAWRPSIDGRRLVDSPALLTPRAEVYVVGENVGRVSMLDTQGRAVDIRSLLGEGENRGVTAVVFARIAPGVVEPDDLPTPAPYADLAAAWRLMGETAESLGVPIRRDAVLVSTLEDAASLEKIQSALDAAPEEIGDALLWAASPEGTIDRFDPDASTAVVLIDRNGLLIGVVSADAASMSDEVKKSVRDEVERLLKKTH